jgi:hypothetical protein
MTLAHPGGGNLEVPKIFPLPCGRGAGEGDKKGNSYTIKFLSVFNYVPIFS